MKNLSITMAEFKELVEENQNDLKMLLDSLPKGWFLCFVYESPEDVSPVKGLRLECQLQKSLGDFYQLIVSGYDEQQGADSPFYLLYRTLDSIILWDELIDRCSTLLQTDPPSVF